MFSFNQQILFRPTKKDCTQMCTSANRRSHENGAQSGDSPKAGCGKLSF